MFRFLRIHTVPAAAEEGGSTWLQLFFDLVYVAILVELGNRISHDLTLKSTVEFALLFIPILLSWIDFVNYGRFFPVDDNGQRILTVLYMAAMLAMAFEIHALTGASAFNFIFTYALSKFILSVMYIRAWAQFPEHRQLTGHNAAAYFIIGLIWFGIAFIAPTNFWFWAVATILGLLIPLIVGSIRTITGRSSQPHPPTKHQYLMHRFGELTIIVLGEFFIKIAVSSEGREMNPLNVYLGFCLLGISVSLWWLYFDHLEHASLTSAGSRIGLWLYGHYPFLAAITLYGVVGNYIFGLNSGGPLPEELGQLFTLALAAAILAYSVVEWSAKEREEQGARSPQPWVRVGCAAALLVLGLWGDNLGAGILVTIVTVILFFQVGLDVRTRLNRPDLDAVQGLSS